MARIYPTDGPREFEDSSNEDEIYNALASLPDDFVVIHSFKFVKIHNFKRSARECDFVIYHRDLGILCIEAKGGEISFSGTEWRYKTGIPFKHDPYDQAADAMYRLIERVKDSGPDGLGIKDCVILSAVWFPSVSRVQLAGKTLPAHALSEFTLTAEDLKDPERKIRSIFNACTDKQVWNNHKHPYSPASKTEISDADDKIILDEVLLPHFEIIEMPSVRFDRVDRKFIRLLDSQSRILDFLVDQRSAVINGAAGTGKTLIAIEHAARLAQEGEDSLFLCVNKMLRDDVAQKIRAKGIEERVTVATVAGLAMAKTGSYEDYQGLAEWVLSNPDKFSSKHIIIDEGQDFGLINIANAGVLEALFLANQEHEEGSFYVFYDERQLIQGVHLPELIRNADCKMTLYVNCRNTKSIFDCSIRGLNWDQRYRLRDDAPYGEPPVFWSEEDVTKIEKNITNQIQIAKQGGVSADNMVVLTCSTLKKSRHKAKFKASISKQGATEWGNTKVRVCSCREFKGLEADVVFLVDVDRSVWEQDTVFQAPPGLLFYTGASRAKHQLYVAIEMSE